MLSVGDIVICMTPKSISDPPDHISTRDWAISSVISPNQSHLTSGPYLRFSVSYVHSDYNMLCSTLVLVLLCRYLHAVCTTLAFVPPVRSSGYCTFHSPSYSSAPPPLIMLCFSIVYKLLDTLLYSSLNIDLSNSSSQSSSDLFEIRNKGAAHKRSIRDL